MICSPLPPKPRPRAPDGHGGSEAVPRRTQRPFRLQHRRHPHGRDPQEVRSGEHALCHRLQDVHHAGNHHQRNHGQELVRIVLGFTLPACCSVSLFLKGRKGCNSIAILRTALTCALAIFLSSAFLNASLTPALTCALTQALNSKCLLNCTPGSEESVHGVPSSTLVGSCHTSGQLFQPTRGGMHIWKKQ